MKPFKRVRRNFANSFKMLVVNKRKLDLYILQRLTLCNILISLLLFIQLLLSPLVVLCVFWLDISSFSQHCCQPVLAGLS